MKRMTDVYHAAKKALGSSALLLGLITAPGVMRAQTTLFGAPSNFDIYNDTGQITHGFEIELDGLSPANVGGGYGFRYASPIIVPIPGGVVIRFASPYVNNSYTVSTVIPAAFTPTGGHSCTFGIAGCDHFGYYLPYYGIQPTKTIYRWLVDDPQNPGTLIPAPNSVVQVPAVTVTLIPPANPGLPPAVAFEIPVEPPPPPPVPKPELQYGEAKWVKVLKNEVQHNVVAPDLLEDNPVVPVDNNPAQVETAWKLLQFNPHSPNSGVLHSQANLGQGAKAVIRKYEFYKFSGGYDPLSHKAICGGDGLCTAPLAGELGDFIGNQMAAANVGVSSVTVTRSGTGSGTVTGGKINCGGTCTTPLALGTVVTLTAKASSNSTFTAWSGDCIGTQPTCTFTVTAENNVTANFDLAPAAGGGGGGGGAASFKISISKNGNGTVTTDPATQSFASGSVVTLTVTPGAGQPWVGWGGACAGTSPTCTLTMDANKSVTANFR
jgi:Divergent InlB B-repeat domain